MIITESTTIWELAEDDDIDTRLKNCLKNDNSVLVFDIISKTEEYFLRTPNFGKKSLDKLVKLLAKHDLHLKKEELCSKRDNSHPTVILPHLLKGFKEKMKDKFGRLVILSPHWGAKDFICSDVSSNERFSERELGFIQGYIYLLKEMVEYGLINDQHI